MDKKTLLAVVFSVVIIVGGMLLQSVLFPAKKPAVAAQQTTQQAAPQATTQQGQQPAQGQAATGQTGAQVPTGVVSPVPFDAAQGVVPSAGQAVSRETDLYALRFNSDGGTLASVQLKKFKNVDGSLVDMVLMPKDGKGSELPFGISFGDYKAAQLREPFALRETSDGTKSTFEFSKSYYSPTGVPFTLRKAYVFYKDEYLFELLVTIENSVNDVPALDFGGYAYTLSMGPQIGPAYKKLDGRNEIRGLRLLGGRQEAGPASRHGRAQGAGQAGDLGGHRGQVLHRDRRARRDPVPDGVRFAEARRRVRPLGDRLRAAGAEEREVDRHVPLLHGPDEEGHPGPVQHRRQEPVRDFRPARRRGGHLVDPDRVARPAA